MLFFCSLFFFYVFGWIVGIDCCYVFVGGGGKWFLCFIGFMGVGGGVFCGCEVFIMWCGGGWGCECGFCGGGSSGGFCIVCFGGFWVCGGGSWCMFFFWFWYFDIGFVGDLVGCFNFEVLCVGWGVILGKSFFLDFEFRGLVGIEYWLLYGCMWKFGLFGCGVEVVVCVGIEVGVGVGVIGVWVWKFGLFGWGVEVGVGVGVGVIGVGVMFG